MAMTVNRTDRSPSVGADLRVRPCPGGALSSSCTRALTAGLAWMDGEQAWEPVYTRPGTPFPSVVVRGVLGVPGNERGAAAQPPPFGVLRSREVSLS